MYVNVDIDLFDLTATFGFLTLKKLAFVTLNDTFKELLKSKK